MLLSCTTTAAELLDGVMADMGLYREIDRRFYRDILNECLARLYTDVFRPTAYVGATCDGAGRVTFAGLPQKAGQAPVRAADVRGVEGEDGRCYLAVTPSVFARLPGAYVYCADGAGLTLSPAGGEVTLIYTARPADIDEHTEDTPLPIPGEYLSLLRAKLRGEAYKLANEEALSAKWLGEYNTALAALMAAAEEETLWTLM